MRESTIILNRTLEAQREESAESMEELREVKVAAQELTRVMKRYIAEQESRNGRRSA